MPEKQDIVRTICSQRMPSKLLCAMLRQTIGKVTRPIGAEFDGDTPMIEKAVAEHIFRVDEQNKTHLEGHVEVTIKLAQFIDFASNETKLASWYFVKPRLEVVIQLLGCLGAQCTLLSVRIGLHRFLFMFRAW